MPLTTTGYEIDGRAGEIQPQQQRAPHVVATLQPENTIHLWDASGGGSALAQVRNARFARTSAMHAQYDV